MHEHTILTVQLEEDIPCRFGCKGAIGIYYIPKGCICHSDPIQALCAQHLASAESTGPITLIVQLGEVV